MKIYTLTIAFDDEKEEIEYLSEELETDSKQIVTEHGVVDIEDYFDEEDLELIAGCYIIGEA